MAATVTAEDFKRVASSIHRDYYSYPNLKFEYTNNFSPITIICPKHGAFKQRPVYHKSGSGCKLCVYTKPKLSWSVILRRFTKIHRNAYDYSKVKWLGITKKITIVCPKHGDFIQSPHNHERGSGCPTCGSINGAKALVGSPLFNTKNSQLIKVKGKEFYVDSKGELLYLKALCQVFHPREVQDQRTAPIISYKFRGRLHFHRPDFYISQRKILIEIKSPFTLGLNVKTLYGASAEDVYQRIRAKARAANYAGYGYRLVVIWNRRIFRLNPNWYLKITTIEKMRIYLRKRYDDQAFIVY